LCDTAVDLLDAGAGAGLLKFLTSGDVVLCTVTLGDPAFGPASGPTASLLSVPLYGTVGTSGTITKFWMTDSNSTVATTIAGTVGTSGADINLSAVVVTAGMIIQVDAISYTAAT
jgi:hypothetical protein